MEMLEVSKTKRETKRIDKRKVFEWDDEKLSEEKEESDDEPHVAATTPTKTKPKRTASAPYSPANYDPADYYSLRDMAHFDAYGTITPSQRRAWESKK